jgi:hypothetical protein
MMMKKTRLSFMVILLLSSNFIKMYGSAPSVQSIKEEIVATLTHMKPYFITQEADKIEHASTKGILNGLKKLMPLSLFGSLSSSCSQLSSIAPLLGPDKAALLTLARVFFDAVSKAEQTPIHEKGMTQEECARMMVIFMNALKTVSEKEQPSKSLSIASTAASSYELERAHAELYDFMMKMVDEVTAVTVAHTL